VAEASMRIQLNVKEIYERLCTGCKQKIRDLIKDKITEQLVSQVLEEER